MKFFRYALLLAALAGGALLTASCEKNYLTSFVPDLYLEGTYNSFEVAPVIDEIRNYMIGKGCTVGSHVQFDASSEKSCKKQLAAFMDDMVARISKPDIDAIVQDSRLDKLQFCYGVRDAEENPDGTVAYLYRWNYSYSK